MDEDEITANVLRKIAQEDVVDVLLPSRARKNCGPASPLTSVQRCPVAMFAVSKVVVEPVVGEPLVDRKPHIVKATDLHDHLPPVVEKGVEGGIADHLVHLDHGCKGMVIGYT